MRWSMNQLIHSPQPFIYFTHVRESLKSFYLYAWNSTINT